MIDQYPAWSVGRSNLERAHRQDVRSRQRRDGRTGPQRGHADARQACRSATRSARPTDGRLQPQRHSRRRVRRPGDRSGPAREQLRRHRDSGDGRPAARRAPRAAPPPARGINGSRARLPFSLDPARTPVMGSWRSGTQQPARAALGLVPAARRLERARPVVACSWCRPRDASTPATSSCSGPATTASRRAALGFADVGAPPAWRNLRAPLAAIPADATQVRLVATDDDLAPAALDRGDPAADPAAAHAAGRRRLAGSGAAGLAGRAGVPVPAAVRPPERRHRGAEVAHPARPVRRRGQLAGDGQRRRRPARHHRAAAARRPRCRPI